LKPSFLHFGKRLFTLLGVAAAGAYFLEFPRVVRICHKGLSSWQHPRWLFYGLHATTALPSGWLSTDDWDSDSTADSLTSSPDSVKSCCVPNIEDRQLPNPNYVPAKFMIQGFSELNNIHRLTEDALSTYGNIRVQIKATEQFSNYYFLIEQV